MHPIEWVTAQPLWNRALEEGAAADRFRRPALLRLAGDDFMQQLQARLAAAPAGLADLVARFETWREPGAGWLPAGDPRLARPPKLYQPAHGRFYLLAASLVCRVPGYPDRRVDAGAGETVSFVLRRLAPAAAGGTVDPANPSTFRERGWVPGQGWLPAPDGGLLPGEERVPLFPSAFTTDGRARRLFLGLVPVASRETFAAGADLTPVADPSQDLGDPREHEVDERVAGALRELADLPAAAGGAIAATASLFALLDLAEILQTYDRAVWNALAPGAPAPPAGPKRDLWTRLRTDPAGGGRSWATALREVDGRRAEILDAGEVAGRAVYDLRNGAFDGHPLNNRASAAAAADALLHAVAAAFDAAQAPPPDPGTVPEVPKLDPAAGAFYVARCVYERPVCAGIHPPALSAPSQPFQLAPFFDPDAPARPIRIQMPVDTSVKGLRKFPRSISFLISDQLRRQMSRIEGIKLGDLDDGSIGNEGGFDLGMICSLSIPIITICALILLMIIVFLLNIVFWWIPFFRICLPLRLKAR